MRRWLAYAGAGLLATLLAALVAAAVVGSGAERAVWFAAALAYLLQLVAFAALLAVRGDSRWFVVGWAGGIFLRFAAVGVVAFAVRGRETLPAEETLLSLVVFMMLLLLLEPVFLRAPRPRGAAPERRPGTR